MAFQPVVDLRTGLIAGAEALARFKSAEGEPYRTPDLWFDDARRCGLSTQLELLAHSPWEPSPLLDKLIYESPIRTRFTARRISITVQISFRLRWSSGKCGMVGVQYLSLIHI